MRSYTLLAKMYALGVLGEHGKPWGSHQFPPASSKKTDIKP